MQYITILNSYTLKIKNQTVMSSWPKYEYNIYHQVPDDSHPSVQFLDYKI